MKITPELLKKYAEGNCTKAEKQFIEEWLPNTEDINYQFPHKRVKDATNEIWEELSADISQSTSTIPLYKKFTRYAAVAIILFTVGVFSYRYSDKVFNSGAEQSRALKTINTQRGEKRTVTLSDGSTIRMNYETEIRVPEQFEGDQRIVYLTGHAHFNVARDTERPFIIYAEDSKTQVLGTSFDINTKKEGETEIIVTSGKVAFSEKAQEDNAVTLTINDRAVLNANNSIYTNEVDALKLTAWRENKLVLDDQSLKEAIDILGPWYDVKIKVKDPTLLKVHFKISLDNPSLQSALDEISFLAQFDYHIEGKTVTIY